VKWLVDGYNVCFAVGLVPSQVKDDELRQGRIALLTAIREGLPEQDVRETVVVFDSRIDLNLPDEPEVAGFPGEVRFSAKYREADDLIEELIRGERRPEKLTVVSSDGRIARAAKRRKATSLTNEAWWEALREGKLMKRPAPADPTAKPISKPLPSAEDTAKWSEVFALDEETLREEIEAETSASPAIVPPVGPPAQPAKAVAKPARSSDRLSQPAPTSEPPNAKGLPDAWKDFAKQLDEGSVDVGDVPGGKKTGSSANPFGEGYADDLLSDQTWLKDDPTNRGPGSKRKDAR
jgi:predicted RNA-binding protein with PIN domain